MSKETAAFIQPQPQCNSAGEERTVGFELEFSGVTLADTIDVVEQTLSGRIEQQSAAQAKISTPLGVFHVEVDWDFLKQQAKHVEQNSTEQALVETLSSVAEKVVPIEVVCPPIKISQLDQLSPLVQALRDKGSVGTEQSLIAAYGVHINAEIPSLDADTIYNYLLAFALLQWWLIDAHNVDIARRVSPYIAPFDDQYISHLVNQRPSNVTDIIDDYLQFNATRNRALDMLPLFAEIDPQRVQAEVDDNKIKARPTFHYRLPNCHIDDDNWHLAQPWNLWCYVERLANDNASLATLAASFKAATRPLVGVNKNAWTKTVEQWINDQS
ncbi:amidoligase family protein [Thalassotalea ponticola]|uniref:amidoligase family protein n=1 Tax=Thalassotalea ponticola TaxID=1523392 RepID=UPI0025B4676C|nr:amidoligase family protein [Thalassotalea ponticola]MDN3652697.1 amidoligase family protein [Thalassotalea ponticola]